MVGSITLLQGPFGVAASTRRPDPKPGTPGIAPVAAGVGASLDPAARRTTPTLQPPASNLEQNQEPVGTVEPGTLFEVSLLAAIMLPADTPASTPPAPQSEPWTPPQSSLSLRDRRV